MNTKKDTYVLRNPYMDTQVHACMHADIHAYITHMHTYMPQHEYTSAARPLKPMHIHTCMHAYIHAYIQDPLNTYILHTCVYMYVCMYVCMSVYMYLWLCVCACLELPNTLREITVATQPWAH